MGEIERISRSYLNASISVSGNAVVQYVSDNAVVGSVSGNAVVKSVYGSAVVGSVYGNAVVQYVYGNAVVPSVYGNAVVQYVCGNAVVGSVCGNAVVQSVYDNAVVQYVSDNAVVQSVYGNAVVQYVYGNAVVGSVSGNAVVPSVYDNAVVQYVYDNAVVKVFASTVKIERLCQQGIVICMDCKIKPKHKDKTAHIIYSQKQLHNIDSFVNIFELGDKKKVKLYKSVKPNNTDFYTGKIKYEGVVVCPDFDPDKNRDCGGGLHLSPTPELTQTFNKGKILECKVDKKDIVVYPYNIQKVRCKKVKVLGEYNEKQIP
jgi:hypothetical protein